MSTNTENTTQENVIAEGSVESAPTTEIIEQNEAVNPPESATGTEDEQLLLEDDENNPKSPKVVRELIKTRKRAQEAERELAYAKGLLAAREPIVEQPERPAVTVIDNTQPPAAPVPPRSEDFDDWESYEQAQAKYEKQHSEYIIDLAEFRFAQKQQAQQQAQQAQQAQMVLVEKVNAAISKDPTLKDIVYDPTLPISMSMNPFIMMSEDPVGIMKWIHNNREEAVKIGQMHPIMMAREFGRIEALIKTAPKPTPPKTVSAAPAPITTVTPASGAIVDEDKLPIDEWIARRNRSLGLIK